MQNMSEEYHELTDEEIEQQRMDTIQLFGQGLQRKAEEQVSLKQELEERWLDDYRHYNGKYDRETQAALEDVNTKKRTSSIFVNLTRAKTNLAESKLSDTILPTDDRNWGIKPTPVPEIAGMNDNKNPVVMANGQTPTNKETGEPFTYAELGREVKEKADKACSLMQEEIDDQLTESSFNGVCRDVIHNACVIGTGVMKGPVVTKKANRSWRKIPDDVGGSAHQLVVEYEHAPTAMSVDPWNYFPDMSATCFDDVEFHFERHLLTKKKVRDLAKRPGFNKAAIRDLLRQDPRSKRTSLKYLNEIREINGITQINQDNRYEIWEYHGPVEKQDLMACGCSQMNPDDPLEEYEGVVWLAHGLVLKVGLNIMDDDSAPYSVFCWEDDETSVFGFGVPYRMRSSQRVMNGSWRMLLDNAGLSTGPQIVVNRRAVDPADGVNELTPRKIWYLKNEKYKVQDAFATFEINSHQEELAAIFQMAHHLADEETSLPQMGNAMKDENQPAVMKTLGGTALWMSSQNITMRRVVKHWDDDITVPVIRRWYYWNMQFNKREEIKGDYQVDARGSSVLLVREIQARNISDFVSIAMSLPGGPERLKTGEILEQAGKSLQISTDAILKSEDDMKTEAEEQQGQEQQPDPEQIKADTQLQLGQMSLQEKQIEAEAMMQARMIDREIQYAKMASEEKKSISQLQKEYELDTIHTEWDREKFYQELGIKQRMGDKTANYGLDQH